MSRSGDNGAESASDLSREDPVDVRGHQASAKPREGILTKEAQRYGHTRTSAAWAAVVVAVLFGVALIDFIAQNTRNVRIDFFSLSGRMPIAVALLASALAGAIVVVAIGVGRVAQLRLNLHRQRRRLKSQGDAEPERDVDPAPTDDEGSMGHE